MASRNGFDLKAALLKGREIIDVRQATRDPSNPLRGGQRLLLGS